MPSHNVLNVTFCKQWIQSQIKPKYLPHISHGDFSLQVQVSPSPRNCRRSAVRAVTCPSITCPGGRAVPHSLINRAGAPNPVLDMVREYHTPSRPGCGYPILSCLEGTPSCHALGTPLPGTGVPLPGRHLGPVTWVPPGKDMGPVEVLLRVDGVPLGVNRLKI